MATSGSAHYQPPITAFSQGEAAAGRTLGIEFEAGAEQGLRNLRAEPPQCPLPGRLLSTTIRRSMSSDMRRIKRCARLSAEPPPNTSRTWQSAQLNSGDRRKRLDDVKILFDPRRARQPEIRLDLKQLL